MGTACCAPQVVDEPMPTHHDVSSLVEDMHRFKKTNPKDVRSVKRYNETKSKIAAYKDRIQSRGHTLERSVTPATAVEGNSAGEPIGAVYGHESFHRRSADRFNKFKETAGKEVRRRSRQPHAADEDQTSDPKQDHSEEDELRRTKAKKVKKGRRGKSKENEEQRRTPQHSVDDVEEDPARKKKKKKATEQKENPAPAEKKKKKKKNH